MKAQRFLFTLLTSFSLSVVRADTTNAAESPMTITLDMQHPGAAIAPDFSGLSFEVSILLPNENGVHYFRSDNLPLINLFHTLGIKSLRIGGNTSDRDAKQLPSEPDLDSLFAFAKAADLKVIYCLRLHNGDPEADAATVKYIMDHYVLLVDCFSIGQEPSAYPKPYSYANYRDDWKKFADAIFAAVPEVKFCGPSVHNNADWARNFMADFGRSNHVFLITEHLYAGGAGNKVPSPEIGRDSMLSDEFTGKYQKLHDGFVSMALSNSLPYRLEEVNNYFNGGATNVSNTFASALWGLDFMHWWAAHGAAGLNFHTGDKVAAGYTLQPSKYTAFFSTTNGYVIRPLSYGIKAFELGSHGKVIPVTVSNPEHMNLSAYAVLGDGKTLCLTIINKEHGEAGRDAKISIAQNRAEFSSGQIISLTAPNNDIAATANEILGGAAIENDGSWNGKWTPLETKENALPTFIIPAGSAVIIRLSAN
jgi:hypothetical protein